MGIALVTKTEYKAYMGISSTNEDAKIDILIPKVSTFIKTICRRTFVDYVNDAKTEYFNGGSAFYVPQETPLIAISSLETSADYGASYTNLTEYTDYVLDKEQSVVQYIKGIFPKLINGYRISYTAGYEILPEDLKLSVLDLITYYSKNDSAIHSNKAPGTNSVQIEYVTTTNLPAHIKRVLDLYTDNYN